MIPGRQGRPEPTRRRGRLRLAAAVLLAVPFLWLPARHLLLGDYAWHLRLPSVIEGGAEAAGLFLLLAAALRAPGARLGRLAAAALGASYLQLRAMLLPALAALAWLEVLVRGGAWLRERSGLRRPVSALQELLESFLCGLAAWTALACGASALGFGSLPHLRLLAVVAGLAGLALRARYPTLVGTAARALRGLSRGEAALAALLLTLVLVQFGKAAVAVDYDSAWYGLRPERVLFGPRSFFDDLRLVHFVYYYPKQLELMLAPLSGLGSRAFLLSANVLVLGLTFAALQRLGRELGASRPVALALVALCGTIPALSNMASSAKSDSLAQCLAFLATLHLWRWARDGRRDELPFAAAALLGMLGTKVTLYAYAPLLLAGFAVAAAARARRARGEQSRPWPGRAWVLLAVAAAGSAGLFLRTWWLTGLPTMPFLSGLWQRVGFSPRWPWTLLQAPGATGHPGSAAAVARYWYKLIFDPSGLVHYEMAWPGNVAVFAALAAALLVRREHLRRDRLLFALAAVPLSLGAVAIVTVIQKHGDGGSDGNYYAVPAVLATFAAAGLLLERGVISRRALGALALAFAVVQLPILFVSHWSWHPGTSAFRGRPRGLFPSDRELATRMLREAGAAGLQAHLISHPEIRSCAGFSRAGPGEDEGALRQLSCAYEDFEQLGGSFPGLFATEAGFEDYLAWARPGLLVAPAALLEPAGTGESPYPSIRVYRALAARPEVVTIRSGPWIALDLSAASCVARKGCLR